MGLEQFIAASLHAKLYFDSELLKNRNVCKVKCIKYRIIELVSRPGYSYYEYYSLNMFKR